MVEILILGLIGSIALGFGIAFLIPKGESGSIAHIRRKNETILALDLDAEGEERSFEVEGTYSPMVIAVKKGAISVKESGCPSQYCVHESWIDRPGQSIICAYNGIVITIEGDSGASARLG